MNPLPIGPALHRFTVCVFGGARSGTSSATHRSAAELGRSLGHRGHRLVYGGGGSGLMGTVAWSAHQAGAEVIGVMPGFLHDRERAVKAPPQKLYLTSTMGERKARMVALADAFVALPGGFGTLDEIFEVLSLGYLGVHDKPLVLLDLADTWRSLVRLTLDVCQQGFADELDERMLRVVGTAEAAVAMVEGLGAGRLATLGGDR